MDRTLVDSVERIGGDVDEIVSRRGLLRRFASEYGYTAYQRFHSDSIQLSTTGVSYHARSLTDNASGSFWDGFDRPDFDFGGWTPSVGAALVDGAFTPSLAGVTTIDNIQSTEAAPALPVLVEFDFKIPTPAAPSSNYNAFEVWPTGSRIWIDSRGADYGGAPGDWIIWVPGGPSSGLAYATFPVIGGQWMRAKVEVWGTAGYYGTVGDPFRAKIWPRGEPEPESWMLDSVSAYTYPYVGYRIAITQGSGTHTRAAVDNFSVTRLVGGSDSIRHAAPSSFVPTVIEGFEAYTQLTANDPVPLGTLSFYNSFLRGGGRGGGTCVQTGLEWSQYAELWTVLPSAQTRVYGCAFKVVGGSGTFVFGLYGGYPDNGYPNPSVRVRIEPPPTVDSKMCQIAVSVGGIWVGSANRSVFNEWHHLCIKVQVAPAGRVILLIDDEPIVNVTAATQTTGPAHNNTAVFGHGSMMLIDDIYIGTTDDTSSSTGDMWGDVRIAAATTAGAGDSTDWIPYPSGPNWQAVSEAVSDEDATYVRAEAAGAKDLYATSAIEPMVGIRAVALAVKARRSDPGPRAMRLVVRSGGSESEGPIVAPPSSILMTTTTTLYDPVTLYPTENYYILTEDPATSSPWEQSALDTIQVGMKIEG